MNNNGYTTVEREFGWDDVIENDGSDYTLLPEGDYTFCVQKFERGRSKGSAKMPPCNMAILTLDVFAGDLKGSVTDNLLLHTKTEWKIAQFFRSIGLKKRGEPLKPNWTAVVGSKGRCHVIVDSYIGNDGKEHKSNKIDKYYEPDEVPAAQPASPGGFWGA